MTTKQNKCTGTDEKASESKFLNSDYFEHVHNKKINPLLVTDTQDGSRGQTQYEYRKQGKRNGIILITNSN